jgi:MinD-like ATPase involved in chromosome partitioning or flagellar assembly/CRP-like cAMP-binding protein/Tfp pilus assembly protein PilF
MELSQIDLFQSLTNAELNEVGKIARELHLGRGELIFAEGAFERNIYIIETGQVEIYKKSPVQGEQVLAILKTGDYFGEMAFFEKTASRSASARTMQASNLIMIEGNDFEKLLHSHPSISLKLLSTLSSRLKESNMLIAQKTAQKTEPQKGTVISVASAKDGYGKSTFAATLSRILTSELGKKVLFFDLDLYFAGASQLFGLHSPRSLIDINNKLMADESKFDIFAETIRINDNFYVVPAPRTFLEAEQIHANDISKIVKKARNEFDYIILDTGSNFDENLFTALDTADFIFFILNFSNLSTITDNVRYFQGIAKLGYPRNRMILLANNINPEFSSSKTSKIFPYPIIGGLPHLADTEPQFGKTPLDKAPNSPYCEMVRLLVRNILKETLIQKQQVKGNIFSKLFSDKDPEQFINLQLDKLHDSAGNNFSPVISSKDMRSQVKYIRYNMMFGHLDEALNNLLAFMEHSQNSAALLELYGEIMVIQEDSSQAIEAFNKAISIDADQHLALGYLAAMTGSKDKLEKAITAVKAKIEKNPSHLDLINDYGKILLKNRLYEDALKQFKSALDKNPSYMDAKINYAKCQAHLEKPDKAIETLLGIESKSPRIFFVLGEIFYKSGRLYLAHKAFNKAASLYPTYPKMRKKQIELGNYMKKLESLIDLHENFVNNNPKFPDLHAKLANFYHLGGKSELAMSEYKKALELNPDYEYARIKLENIQKDVIWRLAKTHLEEALADHQAVTREMIVDIHCQCDKIHKQNFSDDIVIKIKNVRTSRVLQKAINVEQIKEGFARIDCSPLGLVACQDILLFQVINVKNKQVLHFEPHYLTLDEIKSNKCEVTLTIDLSKVNHEEEILPRYFLVHLDSKQFAETISGDSPIYKAVITNKTNGVHALGHLNPENDNQINFVLNGASRGNGSAAVAPGDRLAVKIEDNSENEVFSMEFAVGKSDVSNFCKTIVPQEIS